MSTVIPFRSTGRIEPDAVLDEAKGKLSDVLVLGWDHNDEFAINYSNAEIGELLILLELAKRDVLGHITETD